MTDWTQAARDYVQGRNQRDDSPSPRLIIEALLEQLSADKEPCCDGRLGDDCRCDCHVGRKPSDSGAP